MFDLISRKWGQTVDKDRAEKLIANNTYEYQRNLRPRHVADLIDRIDEGTFLDGSIALARLAYNGGGTVMVNGQHQCTAVMECGKPIIATISYYECKTPEDLALLYRQFDNHAARTLANCAMPEARALNISWCPKIVSLVLTAAIIIHNKPSATKHEKVELLRLHIRDGEFVNSILSSHITAAKHMARGAVAAAMMQTWDKSHGAADTFWKMVRDGENLTAKMPAYRLRNYLISVNAFRGQWSKTNRKETSTRLADHHEMRSRCHTAWNAYRRGQTTDLKYYADKPIPAAV